MAPTYANLTMGYLEVLLYDKLSTHYDEGTTKYIIDNFKRYLDDVFILWQLSHDDKEKFHEILNRLHPDIKFTCERNGNKIPLLDILVTKIGNKINTGIYYKPTDTHLYLPFNSCHPRSTKSEYPIFSS